MCVKSQQVTLWDLLGDPTQSSAGSLASLGASQDGNAEQMTHVTCGPSTTVLFATCVHGGSSARTCPVCCLQVPTQSSPIWTQRATPAGRLYWVLTTSARRTDANECSLSRAWPTPTLDCATERTNRYAQGGFPLTTAVQMWPMPTTQDGKNAAGPSQWNRNSWPLNVAAVAGQAGPQSPEDCNMLGKSRARLNPRWVAQLMGFPADWLDGVEVPSAGSATR